MTKDIKKKKLKWQHGKQNNWRKQVKTKPHLKKDTADVLEQPTIVVLQIDHMVRLHSKYLRLYRQTCAVLSIASFFQWVKLMQTLITDPRLKIRNCKGQPHQDISVTTTPICQGSGSLQMRRQKECKSHWWRLKLGKAVFWPWQSYYTHELCGDLQKACTRSRQPKFQRERERYAQGLVPDRGSTGSVCWGRESYSLEVCGHW